MIHITMRHEEILESRKWNACNNEFRLHFLQIRLRSCHNGIPIFIIKALSVASVIKELAFLAIIDESDI
jgi:hypothetical protein